MRKRQAEVRAKGERPLNGLGAAWVLESLDESAGGDRQRESRSLRTRATCPRILSRMYFNCVKQKKGTHGDGDRL